MDVRLTEIPPQPQDDEPQYSLIAEVLQSTRLLYKQNGAKSPRVGYLATNSSGIVGTCAFKSMPANRRVEIAYMTFPEWEGLGIATEMARQLLQIAWRAEPSLTLVAQTLPVESASTAILKRHGFRQSGTAYDLEAGEVWEWELAPSTDT